MKKKNYKIIVKKTIKNDEAENFARKIRNLEVLNNHIFSVNIDA